MSASGGNARRSGVAGRVAAAAIVATLAWGGIATAAQPEPSARPATVFETSRALAIEAARVRLSLFADDHPLPADGTAPALPSEPCPLASPDTMTTAAVTQNIGLQLDPWLGGTTSSPELRLSSAPTGTVQGIPIVRCVTNRPADGQVTRPEVFAIALRGGVSFGDVTRLYAIDPILRVRPAGIGGEMAGGCLDSANAAVCVVLWQSRSLLIGVTLEGPPAFVNTLTAGGFLVGLVPDVIDTLAVVQRAPLVCNADAMFADTTVDLLEEPTCHDGWAVGITAECPPEDTVFDDSFATTTTTEPPCEAIRQVFHVESDGWHHDGTFDIRCAETLARLGMTAVTAQQFAPICDGSDPALRVGTIRPDRTGLRVVALQIALINLGYDMPVDGRYGPITESAVVDFQIDNGLIVDGITGRQTQTALGI
jgi:hypothetical protein